VTTPSPGSGVFRWAWHSAAQYRAKFLVGGAIFSCVAAGVGAFVVPPAQATTAQKALDAVLAAAVAAALTCIGTYAVALLTALYEQRNALRDRLSASDETVAKLKATPVSQEHADQLRQIAKKLSECLRVDVTAWVSKSPDITLGAYGENPGTLRRAFRDHFPELGRVLDEIEEADTAYSAFSDRLRREAKLAGMGEDPWNLDGFGGSGGFAAGLTRIIRARAMQDSLETPFDFDWHEEVGYAVISEPGSPDRPLVIFTTRNAADPEHLKHTFEEFMSAAEAWPETRNIRASWKLRNELYYRQAAPMLATVANTDPITSRCSLCRGSG
jgi:uncharacterized membrane protein YfbV (UPF0208 family)